MCFVKAVLLSLTECNGALTRAPVRGRARALERWVKRRDKRKNMERRTFCQEAVLVQHRDGVEHEQA